MSNQVTETAARARFSYGYIVAAACFGIQMVGFGIFNSYGVLYIPVLNEFGWSRATLSGANSVSLLVFGFMGILMGSLNDRFGPRLVMTLCGFFFGLGHILMFLVNSLWQLYLFFGVIGVGISAAEVVTLSTIVRWFVKKRAMMSGMTKVGTGIGMLLFPLLISWFIHTRDWRTAFLALGLLNMALMLVFAQFMKRNPPEKQPVESGVEINLPVEAGLSLPQALRTRQFWTICIAYMSITFSIFAILYHIVPDVVDAGISELGQPASYLQLGT